MTVACSMRPLYPAKIPDQVGEVWYSTNLRQHPLVGKLWSSADRRFVNPDVLIRAALGSDYLLLGEKHDNIDHHQFQAWLVYKLLKAGRRPAVVFEMLADDQQRDLARFLRSRPRNAAGLGVAVRWSRTPWPSWAMYQPIADAAVSYRMPVLPGSFPRESISRMVRNGTTVIGPAAMKELGLDVPFDHALMKAMGQTIRLGHLGELPERVVAKIVDMQIAKDAKMANALRGGKALGNTDGAVLIAGAGHVRKDVGVPRHLLRREAGAKVVSVGLIEAEAGHYRVKDYERTFPLAVGLPFDFVWFTPSSGPHDEQEQRDRIRRHHGKIRNSGNLPHAQNLGSFEKER